MYTIYVFALCMLWHVNIDSVPCISFLFFVQWVMTVLSLADNHFSGTQNTFKFWACEYEYILKIGIRIHFSGHEYEYNKKWNCRQSTQCAVHQCVSVTLLWNISSTITCIRCVNPFSCLESIYGHEYEYILFLALEYKYIYPLREVNMGPLS